MYVKSIIVEQAHKDFDEVIFLEDLLLLLRPQGDRHWIGDGEADRDLRGTPSRSPLV